MKRGNCMETVQRKQTTGRKTLDMVYIAVFAGVIAICSWISVPTTIPFTLQTFAVFAAVGILGGRRGTLSILIYILLGIIGLPVFAGFKGGIGAILGNSGGYIVGFLVAALIMWGMETKLGEKSWSLFASMVVGLIACYTFGSVWFQVMYARNSGAIGMMGVLSMCVFPFIIPDLLKITLAFAVTKQLKRYVQ